MNQKTLPPQPNDGPAKPDNVKHPYDHPEPDFEGKQDVASLAASNGVKMPAFMEDDGAFVDPPAFITLTNARELYGLRPGELVSDAIARTKAQDS